VQFTTTPQEIKTVARSRRCSTAPWNVGGNVIGPSATVGAWMTPAQQKTMTFYL